MEGRVEDPAEALAALARSITECRACPRLVAHREQVAREKRRAFREWTYWGRPVPGFGDPAARLLVVGLAPAAHGANRTGRMFTGDRSGDWLVRALHRAGFADRPRSEHAGDGLRLLDCFVTACCRCAPPANLPTAAERVACRPFLRRELELLPRVRVIVALGGIAFETVLGLLRERHGWPGRGEKPRFGHGLLYDPGPPVPAVIASYHPSQQNTATGRLTEPMLDAVFRLARDLLERGDGERVMR